MAMKRPLLIGTPVTSMTGDLPIRDQLDKYLKRLRRTVPFPLTQEEAYFGCMPGVIQRMHADGLFTKKDTSQPGRVSNLLLCLTSGATETQRGDPIPNVVHVNVDERDYQTQAVESVFWFTAPDGVPSPVYRHGTQFFLPEDHPHREKIVQWVLSCLKIEDGIQRAFTAIAKVEARAKAGSQLAAAWPELLHFVKYRRITPPVSAAEARKLRAEVDREISPIEKLNTIELLTTCVMLPERDIPLNAWVNFYMEGL